MKQVVNEISSDSLESHVQWLQDMGTRFFLADNHRQIALKLKRKFISIGYPDTRLDSFAMDFTYGDSLYSTWQYNVIATLPGINHDSVSVIGAHYDNKITSGNPFNQVPGADDNASGVAATLEIARIFHEKSFIPKYTIEFVTFAAEEVGMYGAFNYAQRCNINHKNLIMMLNNDMIAGYAAPGSSDWGVNIIDYDNSTGLGRDAARLCSGFTTLANINDNSLNERSDSFPFYLNGFKALFFIQNSLGHNYHTLNDNVANCNFEFCREISKISCALLIEKNYQ